MAKILIIDDEAQFRKMLRQMLERAGFEVIEAADGKQGDKLFRIFLPSLIITDIFMPEREGLETIMGIKREFPNAKIIAVSGGGRGGDELFLKQAKQFGADRAFKKPFERHALLGAIAELLNP